MTDVEPVVTDFAATGRTGRRNAMPDILGSTAGPGAAELPGKLAELSVGDEEEQEGEGTSSGVRTKDAAEDEAKAKDT